MRGLRVLELAGSPAGAYCGRLFATAGSDVVLAEPPQGAPTRRLAPWIDDVTGRRRSASHEYLDSGKRSVVLADDDLDDALRWADVVVSSADGDPDAAVPCTPASSPRIPARCTSCSAGSASAARTPAGARPP